MTALLLRAGLAAVNINTHELKNSQRWKRILKRQPENRKFCVAKNITAVQNQSKLIYYRCYTGHLRENQRRAKNRE